VLEIRLFGRPQLHFNGVPLSLRIPRRAVSLLAYIALHSDEQLARDALAFLFWPDLPETEARSKLRSHLHYITQGLPRQDFPWLLADKRTVRWNAEAPTWIDVKDFEKLANAKESARAVELYTGDLLSGFEDEWIAAPRARLSERQIELLTGLFEDLRKQGDRARAIQYAQQLLALDPWREDVMAAVIAMRTETGDRAGAVQASAVINAPSTPAIAASICRHHRDP